MVLFKSSAGNARSHLTSLWWLWENVRSFGIWYTFVTAKNARNAVLWGKVFQDLIIEW
jgi:hypothetical protein